MPITDESFRQELAALINRHSLENGSDTPDFILSQYVTDCLDAWDKGVARREEWYGRRTPGTTISTRTQAAP